MIDLRLLTPEQVERFIHLQALLDRQNANNDLTKQRREYYAGEQDIPITTNQRDYLGFLENVDTWSFNIVAQVVDAVSERLSVNGFTVNGDGAEDTEDDAATPRNLPRCCGSGGRVARWSRCKTSCTATP